MKPQFTAVIGHASVKVPFMAPTINRAFEMFSWLVADVEAEASDCSLICHGWRIDATIQMVDLSDEIIEWGWSNSFPEDCKILDEDPTDFMTFDDGLDGMTVEEAQEIHAMIIAERDGDDY